MPEKMKMIENAAGRMVPVEVNGKPAVAYQGVGKYKPTGRKAAPPITTCADYPPDGNKIVADLKTALIKAGLKDGMTISTHHHFRNGDLVANQVFDAAAEIGVKDLMWFPSASFPCHAPIIEHI
jgi:citrate lyase subunit alpha/citrate CoA-transferase